jgi:alpha-L-rhamnosidase
MLLGDLLIWYYEDLAGIQPDPSIAAFKKIIMKPTPVGDLRFIKASHDSPYGMIKSEWKIIEKEFHWNITIPTNTTAIVYVPAGEGKQVMEGLVSAEKAPGVRFITSEGNRRIYEVGSGNYYFKVAYSLE